MGIFIRIAFRNIVSRKKRSLILAAAVVTGLVLITLAQSFSTGASRNIIRTGTTLRTGHINVAGLLKERNTVYRSLPDEPAITRTVRSAIPGIRSIRRRITFPANAFHPGRELGTRRITINGVDFTDEKRLRKDLLLNSGSWSELGSGGTVLIFRRLADKLELKTGDTLSLTARVRSTRFGNTTGTLDLRVAAVAENTRGGQMHSVFMDRKELARFLGLPVNTVGTLLIDLEDSRDIKGKETLLRQALAGKWTLNGKSKNPLFAHVMGEGNVPGWTGGYRLTTSNYEGLLQNELMIKQAIDLVAWILLVVLTVIVFAGISNSLWMSIRERTREVGTVRAVGMKRGQVLLMFLFEGLMLGAMAAIAGVFLGTAVAGILDLVGISAKGGFFALFSYRGELSFPVNITAGLRLILFTTIITGIASLLPAARAAHMKPITAINHIG